MTITIKFFALGRELVGKSELQKSYDESVTVGKVLEDLRAEYPRLAQMPSMLLAVNMEYSGEDTVLKDGDELAIIPPVSGG